MMRRPTVAVIEIEGPATSPITGHVQGVTYENRYWREVYTVRQVHEDGTVTVWWHRQQRETRHGTHVGRDRVIPSI